jgi:hypothetical protein
VQIVQGSVDIVDIEGEMMPADVAVAGLAPVLIGRSVFEYLEVRAVPAAQEFQPLHDGARMHVERRLHPISIRRERAELVERFASDDVHEEIHRLVQVRNRKADMFRAPQARQAVPGRKAVVPVALSSSDIRSFPPGKIVNESIFK